MIICSQCKSCHFSVLSLKLCNLAAICLHQQLSNFRFYQVDFQAHYACCLEVGTTFFRMGPCLKIKCLPSTQLCKGCRLWWSLFTCCIHPVFQSKIENFWSGYSWSRYANSTAQILSSPCTSQGDNSTVQSLNFHTVPYKVWGINHVRRDCRKLICTILRKEGKGGPELNL